MLVKLFGIISLDLQPVPGAEHTYQLPQPKADISKQSILADLADQLDIPADILTYLPSAVTLEYLLYKADVSPAEVLLRMGLDTRPLFKPYSEILSVDGSTLDISTTADILVVQNDISS